MTSFLKLHWLPLLLLVSICIIINPQKGFGQSSRNQKLVDSLITAYDKPYPNDSARVNIILRLSQINKQEDFGCDRCIQFLIEKIDSRYFYGDGISEFDQSNGAAAYNQLSHIVSTPNRWRVLQATLDALKKKDRNEKFINGIYNLLISMSNASIAKAIVEFEVSPIGLDINCKRKYPSYEKNLKALLALFK